MSFVEGLTVGCAVRQGVALAKSGQATGLGARCGVTGGQSRAP